MVVACVALVVALGGVSYAAGVLPKNSVGASQLKNRAVTAKKLASNAVTSAKVKDGSLAARDFDNAALAALTGPQGQQGPKGDEGTTGATGPSDVYSAKSADPCGGGSFPDFIHTRPLCQAKLSLTLPVGDYAVSGKVVAANANTTLDGEAECFFKDNGDISAAHVPHNGETVMVGGLPVHFGTATIAVQEDIHLPSGGAVTMTCTSAGASDILDGNPNNLSYGYEQLRAIRVGAVH
jgi:hypothetical protein